MPARLLTVVKTPCSRAQTSSVIEELLEIDVDFVFVKTEGLCDSTKVVHRHVPAVVTLLLILQTTLS
ncbi:hypothetical protein HZH66_001001 [Vespula vulgaris]|uniref:Uncharacterized protein n=1 Tax=Vespula vulgaris TaxID=7454 RepID=A0A834KTI9_VESVU|nr:hypothetical protein HZH66_001001 [Vespula vulgaris]